MSIIFGNKTYEIDSDIYDFYFRPALPSYPILNITNVIKNLKLDISTVFFPYNFPYNFNKRQQNDSSHLPPS